METTLFVLGVYAAVLSACNLGGWIVTGRGPFNWRIFTTIPWGLMGISNLNYLEWKYKNFKE